jgi:competence protein ComEC
MRSAIAGFVIGVAWLQFQAALPDYSVLLLLFACACLAGGLSRLSRLAKVSNVLRIACGALLGVVWASLFALHYLKEQLPQEWEGRDITLVGTIDSLPYRFERGSRFNFAVERAMDGDNEVVGIPSKIALSWYAGFGGEASQPVPDVKPGERWQLSVRLKRPHGNANPYGFEYEAWLLEQGLRATGYVRPDDKSLHKNRRIDLFVTSFGNLIERTRGWLRDRIVAAVPDKPYAGVLVALVVGDQRAIKQSDWAVFNRAGISHLISISGLHITMIAGMAAALMFGLWRRSFFTNAQLPLLLPAQKAAALAGVCVALLYVLLAGFGVPAQRTLYMLSVVAAALWVGRITSVSHVLCAALGVVVLLDPWAVLWPGFWLSFGAVGVILYVSVGRASLLQDPQAGRTKRWQVQLRAAGRTQYAVTLGLVPLTMLLFGQVSLISPIANAVAIPLISLIVTPLALLGSVLPAPLSVCLLEFAHWLVEWLALILGWMSSVSLAVWTAPMPSVWIFVFALAGTIWMLAPLGWPVRWLGIVCWLPLILNAPARPDQGEMWVTTFDVGQGSAVLIETQQRRLLYDTGPAYSPESDGGNRVILPYLKGRGINTLDVMVVTHNDNDHSGGALSIVKEIPVGAVSSSLSEDSEIVMAANSHHRCEAGQQWNWDGVLFKVMHPTVVSYASTKWKSNDLSCVLKVTAGRRSILLTGDIGWVQEDELIGSQGKKLQSTVLLVPHHGGATSSTLPFLQAVKPEIALFQAGYRNRYSHPRPDVFERYGSLDIMRLRTDQSGAITLLFGDVLNFSEYRKSDSRYWYGH